MSDLEQLAADRESALQGLFYSAKEAVDRQSKGMRALHDEVREDLDAIRREVTRVRAEREHLRTECKSWLQEGQEKQEGLEKSLTEQRRRLDEVEASSLINNALHQHDNAADHSHRSSSDPKSNTFGLNHPLLLDCEVRAGRLTDMLAYFEALLQSSAIVVTSTSSSLNTMDVLPLSTSICTNNQKISQGRRRLSELLLPSTSTTSTATGSSSTTAQVMPLPEVLQRRAIAELVGLIDWLLMSTTTTTTQHLDDQRKSRTVSSSPVPQSSSLLLQLLLLVVVVLLHR